MKNFEYIILLLVFIFIILCLCSATTELPSEVVMESTTESATVVYPAPPNERIPFDNPSKHSADDAGVALPIRYISLGVPNIDSSFKTYMDFRTITTRTSPQYRLVRQYGWSDSQGFMRYSSNGEVPDDYYMIALGSFYGTTIGTKYRITTSTGQVFYGVLADCKANKDTNKTNQYSRNNDVIEFLVDTKKLNHQVKLHGSANVYQPLSGKIVKIERIER